MIHLPRPSRKTIRLPAAGYALPGTAWLGTIGTAGRVAAFADPALARAVATLLDDRCTAIGSTLGVYCLMPDHVHLLVQITAGNLIDVVRDAKSRTTRLWWQHGGVGPLWQRSFYDPGLCAPAAYDHAFTYILENPVRAGLVPDWPDYPYLGGAFLTPHPATTAPMIGPIAPATTIPASYPPAGPVPNASPAPNTVGEGPVPNPGA